MNTKKTINEENNLMISKKNFFSDCKRQHGCNFYYRKVHCYVSLEYYNVITFLIFLKRLTKI